MAHAQQYTSSPAEFLAVCTVRRTVCNQTCIAPLPTHKKPSSALLYHVHVCTRSHRYIAARIFPHYVRAWSYSAGIVRRGTRRRDFKTSVMFGSSISDVPARGSWGHNFVLSISNTSAYCLGAEFCLLNSYLRVILYLLDQARKLPTTPFEGFLSCQLSHYYLITQPQQRLLECVCVLSPCEPSQEPNAP